ncbi:hypothetical protein [Streptomyces sp. SID3343]|uniref:hypothetical protein n=1 Tax=Streptomyces sp. SID3343 TaxID=2690260 RepID=UPI001367B3F0|nr:hypothetical protein [Streptomyces sp. SID3343]MYW04808.1 hypothetical protein [Streptomyces sp. SID3343]
MTRIRGGPVVDKRVRALRAPAGGLVMVVCVGVLGWSWLDHRERDEELDRPRARELAEVPRELCSGMVAAADVEPLDFVRRQPVRPKDESGPRPDRLVCSVGERVSVRVEVGPLREAPADWAWRPDVSAAPLEHEVVGMAGPDDAWAVIPCATGAGDLLARVTVSEKGSPTGPQVGDRRTELVRLLARTGNNVARRAGCGGDPLPEFGVVAAPRWFLSPPTGQPGCIPGAGDGTTVEGLSPVLVRWATPAHPAPIETCDVYLRRGGPDERGLSFTIYRGKTAAWAPPLDGKVDGATVVARTEGQCAGEPVVWLSTDGGPMAVGEEPTRSNHAAVVAAIVQRDGCAVTRSEGAR